MHFRKRTTAAILAVLLVFAWQHAFSQVTANFTMSKTSGCSPLIVQFTDASTGPVTSWQWSFGNGNVSNQKNPGAIYINPGTYCVRLIVSDGVISDTMISSPCITVFQEPDPRIAADVRAGCAPLTVSFTDSSIAGSAPITTWIWDFGDGTTSTNQNPVHTYVNAGDYHISLTLIDANGCQKNRTFTNFITASQVPLVNFGSDKNASCVPPLTVNFADSTQPSSGMQYFWDFGDGNTSTDQNPVHTYTTLGNFTVKLRVESASGCADSLSRFNFIAIEDLVATFTADKVEACAGETIHFSDLSSSNPNTWAWDFGDGNTAAVKNPTHTFASPGVYTVSLIAANSGACRDTLVLNDYITVSSSPIADFSADATQSCAAPFTVQFSDLSSNAVSWLWDFGDGNTSTDQNPSHTYTYIDTFTVTLTVMNADSCYHTRIISDYIKISPPKVQFDADHRFGCAPREVEFADSSISSDPIVSWLWDFGDGNTSTDQNPVHTYTNRGSYHVSLTIVNASGCMATLVDSYFVGVGLKPTIDFIADPLVTCLFQPVTFINNTVNSTSWHWDFGDGGTSDEFEPTHTYSDTGHFTITLIARDNGCPDTLEKVDYVYISPPDAAFSIEYNCDNPYEVSFIDASLGPDTWHWDFGDGTTSTVPSPTHVYSSRGSYTVTLTVTNLSTGCTDVETQTVHVTQPAAAFIGAPTFGCRPLTVNLTDGSIDATAWQWQAGDMTSFSQHPSFTFVDPGTYDVSLIITDIHGCMDTIIKTNYITATGPIAAFGSNPLTGCAPLDVHFTDSSQASLSPITSWNWDFGDGTTSADQHPVHTYASAGYFTVTLTITDADGCQHAMTKSNYIKPTFPHPDFSADTLSCTSRSVQFVNMSVGEGMSFLWDFGDNNISTATNPVHTYTQEGIYTVSLTVTDVNGCDSTYTIPDYVRVADPVAHFGADSTFAPCPPLLVYFNDSSTADVQAWQWFFGDGSSSSLQQPSHVYSAPGVYDVTLIVTSYLGCKDTLFRDDYVRVLGPTGTFTFTPGSGCLNQQIDFSATTQNTAARTWDFGDGTLENGNDSTSHSYTAQGIYHPVLILDDGVGCVFAVPSPDSIVIGDITAYFEAGEVKPCPYETVQFTDLSVSFPGIVSWQWDFGDGHTSTLQHPTHSYDTAGYFDVMLIVSNGICQDTIIREDYIYVTPFPKADFVLSADSGCIGTQISFQDNSTYDSLIVSWDWDFNDGMYDSVQHPTHIYNLPGLYQVQLIVTSATGCKDTTSKYATIYPLPVAFAGPDTAVCRGTPLLLSGSGGISYQWSPVSGLDNPNIATPTATPSDTTEYILTVTDLHGCQSQDTVVINILEVPVADARENAAICIGNTVEIQASGGTSYLWTPSASLNCSTCTTVIASPDTTTTYVVRVGNDFSCYDYDTVTVTVNPRPAGIITPDTEICVGESITLESQDGVQHFWSADSSLSCIHCPNPVATPAATTMYTLLLYNQYNCDTYDSVKITVRPLPDIVIQAENICQGDTTRLIASGGFIYNWSPATGLSCSGCPNPLAYPDSSTTYQLQVINEFQCVNYDSVTIHVFPLPAVKTSEDLVICKGEEVKLTTEYVNTTGVMWTPYNGMKDSLQWNPIARPDATTTYVVTAYNEAGCADRDTVTITVIQKVEASAGNDITICYGQTAQLQGEIYQHGSMDVNVIWYPVNYLNNSTILNPVTTTTQTMTYTMVAFSGFCEPDTNTVTVTVNPQPVIELGSNREVLSQTEITLQPEEASNNIVEYSWTTTGMNLSCSDCESPSFIVNADNKLVVTVTDENGCTNKDSIQVRVKGLCADNIFVPKAFTPNNDERNDKLFIRGGQYIAELQYFRIFDRWGNQVFETQDIREGWNGMYNGKKMNPAVFVYAIKGVCTNGESLFKKGNVTLLR
ncbi:MAG: hypothetical protein KatS3mg031_1918 [Chitinophagales bacterium]|nr:MAG: hypothetical protein KatS3mg031_1918 [Chitinophagales bacterium]